MLCYLHAMVRVSFNYWEASVEEKFFIFFFLKDDIGNLR